MNAEDGAGVDADSDACILYNSGIGVDADDVVVIVVVVVVVVVLCCFWWCLC